MDGLKILGTNQIFHRINRMAYQVYEEHYYEPELYLAGIETRGYLLAEMMKSKLEEVTGKPIHLYKLSFDKDNPITEEAKIDGDLSSLENKVLILVDDVINTGKTLFYSTRPFQDVLLKQLKILVLVHRDHLEFPFHPDYTGLTLATTLQEHIQVELSEEDKGVYLK